MARRRGQRKGSVYRKGPSWICRWWEDVRCSDGTVRRVRFGQVIAIGEGSGAVSKREAQRIARDTVLLKLDHASITPGSLMTLREFVERRFVPEVVSKRRTGGQVHYKNWLPKILDALGDKPLREFKFETIQKFIDEMQAKGYTMRRRNRRAKGQAKPAEKYRSDHRKYSRQSLRHMVNVLSRVFRHARQHQFYCGNLPTEGIELADAPARAIRRALSAGQVGRFCQSACPRLRPLLVTLYLTGMRISEACGLQWQDVDFEQAIVHKRRKWKYGRYEEPKTQASIADIPVAAELLEELALLKQRCPWNAPGDPVFASTRGAPLDQKNWLKRKLKPLAKRLGMEITGWHAFRHSASTELANAGAPIQDRRVLLGHTTDAMNLQYTHENAERMRRNMSLLAAGLVATGAAVDAGGTIQ